MSNKKVEAWWKGVLSETDTVISEKSGDCSVARLSTCLQHLFIEVLLSVAKVRGTVAPCRR